MEQLNRAMEGINAIVKIAFEQQFTALLLCAAGIIWCALFIHRNRLLHFRPVISALEARKEALRSVAGAESLLTAQEAFASDFDNIAEIMVQQDRPEIAYAWEQFRETLIDETENPIRSSARAESYFLHLADDTRALAWAANIAVALGLTFTFLGLIAALTSSMAILDTDGGTASTTAALIGLLDITSVKFWTSVTGIGCSVWLRWQDRRWHDKVQRELEILCEMLDRATLFTPTQRLVAEQLKELREQRAAIQTFASELAASIDSALHDRMDPVVQVLGNISENIEQFRTGSFDQVSRDLGAALREHAGEEMQALAQSLGTMTTRFEHLSGNLSQVPTLLETSMIGMKEVFEAQQTSMRDQQLEASNALASQLGEATKELRDASSQFSTQLAASIQESITGAVSDGGSAISGALKQFGLEIGESSQELANRVSALVSKAEPLGEAMTKTAEAATLQAERIQRAGEQASEAAGRVAQLLADIQNATSPLAEAATSIGSASTAITQALSSQERVVAELSAQLQETANQAERAWKEYSERFADVDEALARTLQKLQAGLNEHSDQVNLRIGELDNQLASAVDKLGNALSPLEDLTDEISELLEDLKSKR